jgi:hypothetical protein
MFGEEQQIPPAEQSDKEAEQQRVGMEAQGRLSWCGASRTDEPAHNGETGELQ